MKHVILLVLGALTLSTAARAAIVERRIWIDTAIKDIKVQMCVDKMKAWRCLWPSSTDCETAMEGIFPSCAQNVLPDLPEYIDSPETKAQAQKVVKDCMTTELAKKYILPLPKDKMDEYNICTGVAQRTKPLNPALQKALDYSKTMTASHCANGTYYRKCWSIGEKECREAMDKHGLDCTMKMEKDGVSPKGDEASIQEAGNKITECTLQNLRKDLDASHKKAKDKECE